MAYTDEFEGRRPPVLTPNPTHRPLLTADQQLMSAGQLQSNVNMPKAPLPPTVESTLAHLRSLIPSARQVALVKLKRENPELHTAVIAVLRAGVHTTPPRIAAAVIRNLGMVVPQPEPAVDPLRVQGPQPMAPLPDLTQGTALPAAQPAAATPVSSVSNEDTARLQKASREAKLQAKRELASGMLHPASSSPIRH